MDLTVKKYCSCCEWQWPTVVDFLSDPNTTFLGFCAMSCDNGEVFYFNHSTCSNTLALTAQELSFLHKKSTFSDDFLGQDGCDGCYFRVGDTYGPCHMPCRIQQSRDIIPILANWPKLPAEKLS